MKTTRIAALMMGLLTMIGCAESTKMSTPKGGDEAFRPTLYVELDEACPTPDGMTMHEESGLIFLNCPNYASEIDEATGRKVHPSVLLTIDKEGAVEKVLDYPPHETTKKVGPMGLDFGPDGHLYVADNQYFDAEPADNMSRVLRVEMDGTKPTGKVDVVVDGLKLANALIWKGDNMYVTDTSLDLPDMFGSGGVWRFTLDELSGDEPVKVDATPDDPHLIVVLPEVSKVRNANAGADGCTFDSEGVFWTGNFGDGVMYKITDIDTDAPKAEKVVDDDQFRCCDGIYYDAGTDLIYVTDSQKNAIHTLGPKTGEMKTIWSNGDTDGADGLLDQPCECVVRDGKLIIVNFDYSTPEWGLTNSGYDVPHTLSVIELK